MTASPVGWLNPSLIFLELVDVDHQKGGRATKERVQLGRALKVLVEATAMRHARHRVESGLAFRPFELLAESLDVGGERGEELRLALRLLGKGGLEHRRSVCGLATQRDRVTSVEGHLEPLECFRAR